MGTDHAVALPYERVPPLFHNTIVFPFLFSHSGRSCLAALKEVALGLHLAMLNEPSIAKASERPKPKTCVDLSIGTPSERLKPKKMCGLPHRHATSQMRADNCIALATRATGLFIPLYECGDGIAWYREDAGEKASLHCDFTNEQIM